MAAERWCDGKVGALVSQVGGAESSRSIVAEGLALLRCGILIGRGRPREAGIGVTVLAEPHIASPGVRLRQPSTVYCELVDTPSASTAKMSPRFISRPFWGSHLLAMPNARFTRYERSEWSVCNPLLGCAARADCTPNDALEPTGASASILTFASLARRMRAPYPHYPRH
jgi:hypothetical protein